MNSSYPPGVTGREPQIAGLDEYEEQRTVKCEATIKIADVDDITGHGTVEAECSFEGDVPATIFIVDRYADTAEISVEWTCPECGTDHQDDETIEPDPDLAHDRRGEEI